MKNDALEKLFIKIKSDKKTMMIAAIGIFGMFLILFSSTGENNVDTLKDDSSTINIYSESELSSSLEKFLSNIDGAGKSEVMITYESYEETVYVYDKDEKNGKEGEKNISSEYIIIDIGDKEDGLKSKTVAPVIRGVAVVCQGGNNPVTKELIIRSISALLDISTNKISVAPMAN